MRMSALAVLTMIVAGCATGSGQIDPSVSERVRPYVDDHARALLTDGGEESVSTGRSLIAVLDRVFGWSEQDQTAIDRLRNSLR